MLCLSARVREHLPERAPCVPLEFGSLGTTAQARPDRNCPRKKRGANGGKNPCGKRRGNLNLTRDADCTSTLGRVSRPAWPSLLISLVLPRQRDAPSFA